VKGIFDDNEQEKAKSEKNEAKFGERHHRCGLSFGKAEAEQNKSDAAG
jgi:hypothetical protein